MGNKKIDTSQPVDISALHHNGCGIAVNPPAGVKKLYVAGTLPGESVSYNIRSRRKGACWAVIDKVITESADRVIPQCDNAVGKTELSPCGGCSLMHYQYQAQVDYKQQNLKQLFAENNIKVVEWHVPLTAEPYHYRHQARIGVRRVRSKNRVLVGFREMQSNYISDCQSCHTLVKKVGMKLHNLARCFEQLSVARYIAQVEVSCGDEHCALVVRHLEPLTTEDVQVLSNFAIEHQLGIFSQPGGPDTVHPLQLPENFSLDYCVDDLRLHFQPLDFVQNNLLLNRQLVAQAMQWLQPQETHKAIDLFCGIGNFSLPIAKRCKQLTGVELSQTSVTRATSNAQTNGLSNCSFYAADLANPLALEQQQPDWYNENYQLALLDPPRSGAEKMIDWLKQKITDRVVYVSCNPQTLVRDLELLKDSFYVEKCALVDMFAHTTHAEVICLLKRL